MPKKTRDQFKEAFKAIKKPDRPKDVSGKDKDNLEDLIDKEDDGFGQAATNLYASAPDYMVDLIAYKYAKHFDEKSEKAPYWVQQVPEEAFQKALLKVAPNDMSDPLSQAAVKVAVEGKGDQGRVPDIMYERDLPGMAKFNMDKWIEAKNAGDKDRAANWGKLPPSYATEAILRAALASGDADAASAFGERLTLLTKQETRTADLQEPVQVVGTDGQTTTKNQWVQKQIQVDVPDPAKILAVAKANPRGFVGMLSGLKNKNEFVEIASDPALQTYLAANAQDEWDELVDETPCLSLLKNVGKKIADDGLATDAEKVEAMFDAIVNNDGIPLAYATNTIDNNRVILTGGTQSDKDFRAQQKSAMGAGFPDLPSTQCHQLLHLTTEMTNLCPGLSKKPKITQGTIDHILLTAPLSAIPGEGLLDKGFGGNVFDESGASLDRILFTGDGGINSHTWLVIDNVPYDPVLGTRGGEVAASVGEEFKWVILDRLAKSDGGNYIVKGAREDGNETPKPAANKMGFGTGYLMTTTPEKFLTAGELEKAGITVATESETESMTS